MSVIMAKTGGVTVLTLTSDPKSRWPPLCQLIGSLCYSPVCCSVSQPLKSLGSYSQTILGTLQIMVGLITIGLASILSCSRYGSSWQMDSSGFPYWFGGLFIFFGIVCILSEKYPSPCLIIVNVILNLAGVGFAIAAIYLYSINLANVWVSRSCSDDYWYREATRPPVDPYEKELNERCMEGKLLIRMLLQSINAMCIILSVLELCIVISSVVKGIKTLKINDKEHKLLDDTRDVYIT